MDRMDLLAMQASKVLKLSRDTTRISADNLSIKAELAAINHPCWMLTSGPSILEKDAKFCIKITKRPTANSIKGKRIRSSGYRARLSAEMDLFAFRLSKEKKSSIENIMSTINNMHANKNHILISNDDEKVSDL